MNSMPTLDSSTIFISSLENLRQLRNFEGKPRDFWALYLETLATIASAKAGLIAIPGNTEERTEQLLAVYPNDLLLGPRAADLKNRLALATTACAEQGFTVVSQQDGQYIYLVLPDPAIKDRHRYVMLFLEPATTAEAREALDRLKLLADIPAGFNLKTSSHTALVRQSHIAGILDLITHMNSHTRFLSALMTFCNELAARYKCERVSIGWLHKGRILLRAISHVDRFDAKMDSVRSLEMAMEESIEQNSEILYTRSDHPLSNPEAKAHQSFAKDQDVAALFSLPFRVDNKPIAICMLERSSGPLSDLEQRLVRISCDLVTQRLQDMHKFDRWFGAIIASNLQTKAARLIGFEHTGAKALAIAISVIVLLVCSIPVTYRVQATAILRTEKIAYLSAPFDGHIEEVSVRLGDAVTKDQALLELDKSELLLEQANAEADRNRYEREAEKARALDDLSEMLIAEALRDQTAANLDLVKYKISQSGITAPFSGTVVEGDLMERSGFPVKQGEVLFKIGRTDSLFADLEVKETDIHAISNGINGKFALLSRPGEIYPCKIFRIEPAVVAKKDGGVFIVQCSFLKKYPSWWQPGMTGVAQLNAGRKTLLWILTHRTTDFLRLKLWW